MDEILTLLGVELRDIQSVNLEDTQDIYGHPLIDQDVLSDVLIALQQKLYELTSSNDGNALKYIASILLHTLHASDSFDACMKASQCLLLLLSVPGANAYGLTTYLIIKEINDILSKVYQYQVSTFHTSKTAKKLETMETEDVEGEEPFTQSMSQSQPNERSSLHNMEPVSSHFLVDLLSSISAHLARSPGSMSTMKNAIDALVGISCIHIYNPAFSASSHAASALLLSISRQDAEALLTVCASLLPLMVCKGSKEKVTSIAKYISAGHRHAVDLLLQFMDTLPFCDAHTSTCLIGALQRLLLLTTDKAEPRALTCASITRLLTVLHDKPYAPQILPHFLQFLLKLSNASKVLYRSLCTDIAANLLGLDWLWDTPPTQDSEEDRGLISVALLRNILTRCQDVSAAIRLRAVSALHAIVNDLRPSSPVLMRNTLVFLLDKALPLHDDEETISSASILDLLRDRCYDDRPLVKAKALGTLELILTKPWKDISSQYRLLLQDEDIAIFVDACADNKSISVRKQALGCLHSLLVNRPADPLLHESFAQAALPLVFDAEASIQTKLAELLVDVLFDEAVRWHTDTIKEEVDGPYIVWQLCRIIVSTGKTTLLKSALKLILKQQLLGTPREVTQLLSALRTACTLDPASTAVSLGDDPMLITMGGWTLLEALVTEEDTDTKMANKDAIKEFTLASWTSHRASLKSLNELTDLDCLVLNVLQSVHERIPDDKAGDICSMLLQDLQSMECQPAYISSAMALVYSMHAPSATNQDIKPLQTIVGMLLSATYEHLHQFIFQSLPTSSLYKAKGASSAPMMVSTAMVSAALYLLGVVSMLGFTVDEDESRLVLFASDKALPGYYLNEDCTNFKVFVPQELIGLVKLLLTNTLPSSRGCRERATSHAIRAHAFLCMGKLCVRDKALAKEHLNIFLRELRYSDADADNEAVRSNALFVLGDICVRHTSIVDKNIGALAVCLQDSSVLVKRNALVILSQLLLQDFIRWRGVLLFRFVACVADSDEDFADFAKYLLRSSIFKKYPDFFTSHISEAILLYNGCTRHPVVAALLSSGAEGALSDTSSIALDGAANKQRRQKLYLVMMEDLKEEEKIMVTAKIVSDVISDILENPSYLRVDSTVKGNALAPIEHALEDAFWLLQCSELKVGKAGAGADADDDLAGDEPLPSTQEAEKKVLVAKAKAKILKKLSLQHLVNHIIPMIVTLKKTLQQARSPVQRSLMLYLIHLRKTHKNEVTEALSADPMLEKELEFDLKLFTKEEDERVRKAALAVENDENAVVLQTPNGKRVSFASPGYILGSTTKGIQTPSLKTIRSRQGTPASLQEQLLDVDLNSPEKKRGKGTSEFSVGGFKSTRDDESYDVPHASTAILKRKRVLTTTGSSLQTLV